MDLFHQLFEIFYNYSKFKINNSLKLGKNCGAKLVPCYSCNQPLDPNKSHPSKWIQRLNATVTRYHSYNVAGPLKLISYLIETKKRVP